MPRIYWFIRNLLVFFVAVTIYASVSQVFLLAGSYSPVAYILTPSAMPWYPPLSLVFLSPYFDGRGWGIKYIDTAVGYKVPVMHYYTCIADNYCIEYIPNTKSAFGSNPIETLIRMTNALIPPYPPGVTTSESPDYGVLVAIPSWIYIPLLILAFRYALYYKARRVW